MHFCINPDTIFLRGFSESSDTLNDPMKLPAYENTRNIIASRIQIDAENPEDSGGSIPGSSY